MVHCKLKGKHIITQTNTLNQEGQSYQAEDERPHQQTTVFAELFDEKKHSESIFKPWLQKCQYLKAIVWKNKKTWKWRLIYIRKDMKMLRKPTLENVYNAKTFLNDFRWYICQKRITLNISWNWKHSDINITLLSHCDDDNTPWTWVEKCWKPNMITFHSYPCFISFLKSLSLS